MALDPQQILLIGTPPAAIPASASKFFDAFNVNDFQLVAWNAETFVEETQEKTGQSLQSYHHPFIYRRFKELYEDKIIQILNWIKYGHVLVIFPCLFNSGIQTDGPNGAVSVNLNQFPPFNLVNLTPVSAESLDVVDDFRSQFRQFVNMLSYDVVLSGEDIVPLFRTATSLQGSSTLAGAAFRVGRGAIVFSPKPKAWSDPKVREYLEALAELPEILGRPVDPLPEKMSRLQRSALWFVSLPALIIAGVLLSPFWAPQVGRLLPWGETLPASGRSKDALAARLSEIEKRSALSSFDVDAIKSAENALAHRFDRLEAALSRLEKSSTGPPPDIQVATTEPEASPRPSSEQPVAPVLPAASPHLSAEEIVELLARGDILFQRGDVASARLFYERAADAGDGRAALRAGATFDPTFLDREVLRGVHSDRAEARLWYHRAGELGEAEAEGRLKNLETSRAGEPR
jgi:hypothetical protein